MRKTASIVSVLLAALAVAAQGPRAVDTAHSRMTVRVYRGGLFGFAGDNHEIRAPITSGAVDEGKGLVRIQVDARRLQVVDPQLEAKKRAEVQQTMHSAKVLDSTRYPEIWFRSTEAKKNGEEWIVVGELTLHGQTKPAEVRVKGGNGHYTGSATIKQRDFGMEPVSVAGGTVKVKNEVRVEFDVTLK